MPMTPPTDGPESTRYTLYPRLTRSSEAWMPPTPPPTTITAPTGAAAGAPVWSIAGTTTSCLLFLLFLAFLAGISTSYNNPAPWNRGSGSIRCLGNHSPASGEPRARAISWVKKKTGSGWGVSELEGPFRLAHLQVGQAQGAGGDDAVGAGLLRRLEEPGNQVYHHVGAGEGEGAAAAVRLVDQGLTSAPRAVSSLSIRSGFS